MHRKGPAALCLLAMSACAPRAELAVAPDIASVEWQAPVSAPASSADAVPALDQSAPNRGLGEALGSLELQRLIARALAANADIAIATTRIEAARADLRIAKSAMLPVVSAAAGASATRSDDRNASLFSFSEG